MNRILCLIAIFFISSKAFAQPASSYIYSTNPSVTLENITAGTTLFGVGIDDQASALNPIGFTFTFAGIPYTQFSASTNGVVCLGATAFTTFTNTFPANASVMPVLMPFWDDLYTNGNGLRYQLFGTAPNRKLVIDWEVTNCCGIASPDKHFQVWLYETSNVVQYVYDYGSTINSATVGIASSATEFHSITTTTHTSSTATPNNANNTWPGLLRSYIFSPPLPCTGTPTAGTAVVSPNPPCPNVNFTVSLSGSTVSTGLTYQWISSATGTPGSYSIVPAANTAFHTTQFPAGTTIFYRCIVTCTSSSGFDTSLPVQVNVQTWSPTSTCYCTSNATAATFETIHNVTMGLLNNTTNCATPLVGSQGTGTGIPNQYTNFTSGVSAPFIYTGLAQNFSISIGNCSASSLGSGVKIYIDYNHDAVFGPGEEAFFSGLTAINSIPSTVVNGTLTVPLTALSGLTRMRVINQVGGQISATTIVPCGTYNNGETEDYLVNIIPPAPYDPGVVSLTHPAGNCYTANQVITAQVRNFGSTAIDLSINPVVVTLNVNGPNGLVQYLDTLDIGLLTPFAASSVTAIFTGVNMFTGGNYLLNTSLTISGVVNGNIINDSLASPILKLNFRPTAGAPYQLCQFSPIPFGQGLTVSGCAIPINDSVTINFTVLGPCNDGNNDASACQFANAVLPALQPGATFQSGILEVTNLSTNPGSWRSEVRMNLYGTTPVGTNLFSPGVTMPGSPTSGSTSFTHARTINSTQLGNMFAIAGIGNPVNVGYWESFNDVSGNTDININALSVPTTVTLKIYYQWVPASFEWYSTPTGGFNLYSFSPFNPLITTGSGLSNSNTPNTYTWFAACSGNSNCRVPVNLVINPTPQAFQDTLSQCEFAVSSNSAIFDLTTMNNAVSGNNALASVDYFFDEPLLSQILNVTNDTSSTNVIYSKVFYPGSGCFSKDTLLLQVNSLPEFPSSVVTGFACAPGSIDVSTLINPFSTAPPGTDTLYYDDATFTTLHPNPTNITTTDTVYMVFATNTNPVCSDTAVAYVDILQAGNLISAQTGTFPVYYSNAGNYGCAPRTLVDGMSDTIRSSSDCRRVAAVTDLPNSTSLGLVNACQEIAASTPYHNGQPYVNRTYQITASTSDTAVVCLYYLDQDFQDYNADALFAGWPTLPSNICISKVDNGDLNTPGHTAVTIPNALISTSYDPISTVWTVCFPVSGFSYFYCHACNPVNAPLPIDLTLFTGRQVNNQSLLSWTTASEQNNSHFIVERSKDGTTFNSISSAIASKANGGNSSTALNYSFTDELPMLGHNYYRLQQHDIDGKVSTSQVVDIYYGNDTKVTLFPNPVSQVMNVDINTPKATSATLKVTDATGRVVKVISMQLSAGANNTQVDLQGLADGMYMVHITNGKGLDYAQPIRKN